MADAAPGPRSSDPLIGTVLDRRYQITGFVGAGGAGTVYKARQLKVDRDVAVKLLSPEVSGNEEAVRRFENEARIISLLRHPNTLKLIEYGHTDDGRLYIVTELLRGESLSSALNRGPIGQTKTLAYLKQICDSLEEAHAEGIIHRDLKPGNIFIEKVGAQELIKVLDFGIAKITQSTSKTQTGMIFGTPAYSSPEQASGEKVDARSDIYSLGCIAYHCVAGGPVFTADSHIGVIIKHMSEQPTPPSKRPKALPMKPEFEALILRMLAKKPDDRPPSVVALRSEIEELIHFERVSLPPGEGRTASLPPGEAATAPSRPAISDALPPSRPHARAHASTPAPAPLAEAPVDNTAPLGGEAVDTHRRAADFTRWGVLLAIVAIAVVLAAIFGRGLFGPKDGALQVEGIPAEEQPKAEAPPPPPAPPPEPAGATGASGAQPSPMEPPKPEPPKPEPAKAPVKAKAIVKAPPAAPPSKATGRVIVTVIRADVAKMLESTVLVDGRPRGKGSRVILAVDPGLHQIEVRPEGYPAQKRTVRVDAGASREEAFVVK